MRGPERTLSPGRPGADDRPTPGGIAYLMPCAPSRARGLCCPMGRSRSPCPTSATAIAQNVGMPPAAFRAPLFAPDAKDSCPHGEIGEHSANPSPDRAPDPAASRLTRMATPSLPRITRQVFGATRRLPGLRCRREELRGLQPEPRGSLGEGRTPRPGPRHSSEVRAGDRPQDAAGAWTGAGWLESILRRCAALAVSGAHHHRIGGGNRLSRERTWAPIPIVTPAPPP